MREATSSSAPSSPLGLPFHEADLRALVEAIRRKEGEAKRLRRLLAGRSHVHNRATNGPSSPSAPVAVLSPSALAAEERIRERMSLLSGIRGLSGLSTLDK